MLTDLMRVIESRTGQPLEFQRQPNRGPMMSRINQSSFERYATELLIPHLLERHGTDPQTLTEQASLPSLTSALSNQADVRVFHNANDFILSPGGLDWLRETLGDRLTVFPDGGYLGNLWVPQVQESILDALDPGPGVRDPSAMAR